MNQTPTARRIPTASMKRRSDELRPGRAPLAAFVVIWVALAVAGGDVAAATTARVLPTDLSRLSIEELANLEISSVSRRPEALSDAAAAVYVITREDIRRAGSTTLPEALRLAPNLQVAVAASGGYAITARGFNSTTANKLLVMIDGRSIYTPLFSGVFWDVQDVMLEDIERIEVVSGPGGTLWGSNAVNGVINIITRRAAGTQGSLVSAVAGNEERGLAARHGGKLSEDASYRIYAKGQKRDDTVRADGARAEDAWQRRQAGFRMDWARAGNTLVLQGDAYSGAIDQPLIADRKFSGANLQGFWSRALSDTSALHVQAYFDRTRRVHPEVFGEVLDTYDVEAQHRFRWAGSHDIVWGGGYRHAIDDVTNTPVLAFLPAQKKLRLANVFAQDSIALSDKLQLTVGAKLEHNTYTGLEFQPNLRLALKLPDYGLLWGAVSRAVRTPSRVDRELFAPSSPPFLLAGGPDFVSEKLLAYELGYRLQSSQAVSLSISIFYNVYDELRTLEPTGTGAFVLGNGMEGDTYGLEAWGSYQVNAWWRLDLGYSTLYKDLQLKAGSSDTTSLRGADTDPSYQFFARSRMNFTDHVEFDLALRAIDALPSQNVPRYTALDTRLGWHITKAMQVALIGKNLLDRSHPEFGTGAARPEVQRSVFVNLQASF